MAQARWQRACQAEAVAALLDGHEGLLGLLGRHCTCAWYRRAAESDHGLLDGIWGTVARALSHVARTRRRLQRGASATHHPSALGRKRSAPLGEASTPLGQPLQSGRGSAASVESLPARARTPSPGGDGAGMAVGGVEAEPRRLSPAERLSLDAALTRRLAAPPSAHAGSVGLAAQHSALDNSPPPLRRPTPQPAPRVGQKDGGGGGIGEGTTTPEVRHGTSSVSPTELPPGPAAIIEGWPLERGADGARGAADMPAATATESAEGPGEQPALDRTSLTAAAAGAAAALAPTEMERLGALAALDAVPYASHAHLPPRPPDDSSASAADATAVVAIAQPAPPAARLVTGRAAVGPIERYFIHRANEAAVAVAAGPSMWNALLRDLLPRSAHAAEAATRLQAHARAASVRKRLHASEVGALAAAEGEDDQAAEGGSAATLARARAAVARARAAVVAEPGGGDAVPGGGAEVSGSPRGSGAEAKAGAREAPADGRV